MNGSPQLRPLRLDDGSHLLCGRRRPDCETGRCSRRMNDYLFANVNPVRANLVW